MSPDGKSAEAAYPLRTVSALVGQWIGRLGQVWVQGQLVQLNLRQNMVYATLRDEHAEVSMDLKCSRITYDTAGQPPQGTVVTALVKPDFYGKSGRLSLFAAEIRAAGEGSLLLRVEQLKRQLQAEGLFDPSRRRTLPFLPRRIGLITGADTAAERDVVHNLATRWPVPLEVRHTLVQGPRAAAEIIVALRELDALDEVDVIVVARGGGSFEDLLPFSDEGLVRAAAASRTPIVSAVGHETDNPLLDYVADLRVSTPTGAAKTIVPSLSEESARVATLRQRLQQAARQRLEREAHTLSTLRSRPVLRNPVAALDGHDERVTGLRRRLEHATRSGMRAEQLRLETVTARMRALSPQATLKRGYSILIDDAGETVGSVEQVHPGDDLAAYVADGQLFLTVLEDE